MQKRFNGKLTELELKDVQRILRTKTYWPKMLLRNWYGLLLFCAVVSATIAGMIGTTRPNWTAVGVIWLVIIGILAWSAYRSRKSFAAQSARLNSTLPTTLEFESRGVHLELPEGATAFHPWQSFSGWREGERVILLDKRDKTFLMVSITELPEIERDSLRRLLRSSIAPETAITSATK